MPPHPTLYLRKSVYDKFGTYNTDYKVAGDYEAMLRYLVTGRVNLAYLQKVMVKMRLGGVSNKSLAHIVEKSKEDLVAIHANGLPGYKTLLFKNFRKVLQFI